MNKLLELKNISKTFNTLNGEIHAIEDISFDVYKGEFIGIVGSSGCGKSTLLNIIDELDKNGVLDNTVIVIYGDHDAKLKKSEFKRFYNYDPDGNPLLESLYEYIPHPFLFTLPVIGLSLITSLILVIITHLLV